MGINIFNVSEIVELGIEKEKRRRDFYARAADIFADEELKKLFSQLRDWEETHIKKFSDIRVSIVESNAGESYTGERSAYMQALVGDKLYQKASVEEFGKKIITPLDAIFYGIEFEKDAILFFSELLAMTKGDDFSVIEEIVNEEKQHIVFLALMQHKIVNKTRNNKGEDGL